MHGKINGLFYKRNENCFRILKTEKNESNAENMVDNNVRFQKTVLEIFLEHVEMLFSYFQKSKRLKTNHKEMRSFLFHFQRLKFFQNDHFYFCFHY